MILKDKESVLINLGFERKPDLFSSKEVWVLGEEVYIIDEVVSMIPILYYNIENSYCKISRGEFCVVQRECKSREEIIKFIEYENRRFRI